MRYSLLASLSLLLLLGTACRKSDSDLPSGRTTSVLLDSITSASVSNSSTTYGYKFRYDANDNLVQHIVNNQWGLQFRYDAQNRLNSVSGYSNTYPGSSGGDTLLYSANSSIIRSCRYVSGITSLIPSRTYVFDSNNRLMLDSIYDIPYFGVARTYIKYNYNAANDIQSTVMYGLDRNSTTAYSPGDSLVYTYDTKESPFYRCSFAFYCVYFRAFVRSMPSDLIVYDPDMCLVLSKHNPVSSTVYHRGSTQPGTVMSYNSTYSNNGLIQTRVVGYSFSANYDVRYEFLYR